MLLRIQIASTGKFLVLNEAGTLTVELHTTLFNGQTNFFGSFSYPGQAPLEPNRAMLQNAHYISTDSKLRTFMVLMWLGDVTWKQVKFTFTIQDDVIDYNLYIDTTLITNKLTKLTLNALTVPGVTTQVALASVADLQAYMKSTCTAKPGAMPVVFFPYRNDGAYKAVAGPAMHYAGNWNAATNTPALHDITGVGTMRPIGAAPGWVYYVPAGQGANFDFGHGPVLFFGGDYAVFDGARWYRTGNPYGTPVAGESTDLIFPTEQVINRWEMDALGNGYFKIDPAGGPYMQTQTPCFYLTWVLRRIAAFFNCTIEGRVMDEDWFNRLTIWSRLAISNGFVIGDMAYFLPGIIMSELLKAVRTELGVMIDFDMTRNVMIIESLANLEKTNDVVDLRPLEVKSYREITNSTTFYVITQHPDSGDGAFPGGDVPPTMQIGDTSRSVTETDITLTSVPTQMIEEVAAVDALLLLPPGANWRIPHIKMPMVGQSPMDQITTVSAGDENNFKLRFIYWHGMVPNSSGFVYPYGSSDNLNVAGQAIASVNLSLSPANADFSPLGYFYNFVLNSKPFELGVELNKWQLLKLRANQRFLARDPFSQATVSCVLDQLASDLQENQELIPTKITLYPKISPNNTVQGAAAVPVVPVIPPVDNGLVYARFALINQVVTHPEHPTPLDLAVSDLQVTFWADSAGTVPKNVTDLNVGFSTQETITPGTTHAPTFTHANYSGTSAILLAAAATSQNMRDGSGINYTWVYLLLSSAYYTIIV